MFQKGQTEIVEEYIEEIYDNKVKLSNYYSLDLGDIEYFKTDNSIVLRKSFPDFSRLYFLTDDPDDLKNILRDVEGTNVINIPSKNDISDFDEVMTNSGFELFRVYETYYNDNTKGNDLFVEQFAGVDDIETVKTLLYNNLNIYSDHLPSDRDLMEMIKNKQVLVNYENDKICGILIFTIQATKCYLNFWVDIGKNGLFLMFNIYNFLAKRGIKYSYLWVNTENEKVKAIHKLFGSKPGGTKDFIYIKKSNNSI